MDRKYVVLCVDDEVNILKSLERTLRTEGYKILTASSGPDAIKILEQEEVDLVIVDERMPVMSGSEFLRIIKKKYPEIISIMISGYSNFNSLVKAVNEGEIFRFIPKPWDTNKMREVIRQALAQDKVKHIVDDSIFKDRGFKDLPDGCSIETSQEQNSIVLKVVDPEKHFDQKYVASLLNYVLESIGVQEHKRLEITSGAIRKMHEKIVVTININEGLNLKIEFPRETAVFE